MAYRPSGFVEYLPIEQKLFDDLYRIIEQTYQQFGYSHLDTPAVERNDVLLAKTGDETSQQIFGLRGLAQNDPKDYSLRYDHTVPLARYVLDWQHTLTFPFKRYAIGKVWRGERAQKGRYREFYQADIDAIWPDSSQQSYLGLDAEMLVVAAVTIDRIFDYLELPTRPTLLINHRKVAQGLFASLTDDESVQQSLMALLDRRYKISRDEFVQETTTLGLSSSQSDQIIDFITTVRHVDDLDAYRSIFTHPIFAEGCDELCEMRASFAPLYEAFAPQVQVRCDMSIVRGLAYYTGTVYETMFEEHTDWGSMCSGGRYEGLTTHIDPKQSYSGVGISIGLSRFYSILTERMGFAPRRSATEYLFVHFADTYSDIVHLAQQFVSEGQSIEIYPVAAKLGKQFGYADKKGIPNVVILGSGEKEQGIYKVKNLESGEERECEL